MPLRQTRPSREFREQLTGTDAGVNSEGHGMLGRAGMFINKNLGSQGGKGDEHYHQQQQYREARSDTASPRMFNAPSSPLPPRAAPAVIASPPTLPTTPRGYLPPSPQGTQPRFSGDRVTGTSPGMGQGVNTGGGGGAFPRSRNAAAVASLNERMSQYKASAVAGGGAYSPPAATRQASLPRFNQINNFAPPPPPSPTAPNPPPRQMTPPTFSTRTAQSNGPGASSRTLMTSKGQGQAPSDRAQGSRNFPSPRKLFGAAASSPPATIPPRNGPVSSPTPSSFGNRQAQKLRLQQAMPGPDQRDPSDSDENDEGYETETRSSGGIDVGMSTSFDDTRTYETGTVGSATLWTASYTTREDEETATYMSGTVGSATIKNALSEGTEGTTGTDAYQSIGSAYHASGSSYETDNGRTANHREDTQAGRKKKGSRFSWWRKARKASRKQSTNDGDDDDEDTYGYDAVDDRKRSRGRGHGPDKKSSRNRTPGSSSRSILPSPSAGTATVAAYVEKRDKDNFYQVKQRYGYLSIILTLLQTILLASMVAFCGLAPMNINEFIGPYPDALSEWGAKNAYLMLEMGQWWRFFTPQMLSVGVLHLLCNGYVQLTVGAFFEREWGSIRWGTIYFCSAVGSTIASTILDPNSISVGSSGALMGIFGAKMAEVLTMTAFETFHGRDGAAIEQLGGTLCSLAVVCILAVMPMIDWSGHMGGLATGFFLGMIVFGKLIRKLHLKAMWQLLGLALFIAGLGLAINELVNEVKPSDAIGDACDFYKDMFGHNYDCTCAVSKLFKSSYNNDYEENYTEADGDGEGDDDNAQGWEEEDQDDDAQEDMSEDDEGQDDHGEEGDAERMLRRLLLRWLVG